MTGFRNRFCREWLWALLPLVLLFGLMLFSWYVGKDDAALSAAVQEVFEQAAEDIGAKDMISEVRCVYQSNWWVDPEHIDVKEITRIETVKLCQTKSDELFAQDVEALLAVLRADYDMEFELLRFFVVVDRTYTIDITEEKTA